MKTVKVEEIEEGDIFDCPVYTSTGEKIIDAFTFFRDEQLQQLRDWQIDELRAETGPLSSEELKEYRQKARQEKSVEETTTQDIFESEDPVADGYVEPASSLREPAKRRVKNSYKRCLEETRNVLKPLSHGIIEDAKTLYDIVQPIFEVAWNMDAALLYLLADIEGNETDDYLFPYSLHSCLISILLGIEIGYDKPEVRKIGVGGLIHDVGMLKIPQHIRLATGKLTDQQYQMIETHPERGARILSSVDRLEDSVIRIAAEHHEQVDGSGYPLGVEHQQIHPYARIVNLAMTFVAMTQSRSHRTSLTAQESIFELVDEERDRYDDRVLRAFLKRFGLFPPGTFGRLNTGHLVLVLDSERDDPKNPIVKVLTSPGDQWLDEPFKVELSNYDVRISKVVHDLDVGGALELA